MNVVYILIYFACVYIVDMNCVLVYGYSSVNIQLRLHHLQCFNASNACMDARGSMGAVYCTYIECRIVGSSWSMLPQVTHVQIASVQQTSTPAASARRLALVTQAPWPEIPE